MILSTQDIAKTCPLTDNAHTLRLSRALRGEIYVDPRYRIAVKMRIFVELATSPRGKLKMVMSNICINPFCICNPQNPLRSAVTPRPISAPCS